MKPALFDYSRPVTLEQALAALRDNNEAAVIAGGQSLLPMLNLRATSVEALIDISALSELRAVTEDDKTFSLGALVIHAQIEDGLGSEAFAGLLQRIAAKIAYRAVRNMGTIGGSLALCDPAADWPACFLALGATAVLRSAEGERQVPLGEFLLDAYTTSLEPGELLTRIDVPKRDQCRWGVSKVTRKSGAFADSLAIAVLGSAGFPSRVTLTGTASCAQLLPRTSTLIEQEPDIGTQDLSQAIGQDVGDADPEATPYQYRCHIHTVTNAISEASSWSR